jgi:NAD(P)-dependent dehydrogenase (short-subunit alcohol dehydrogenase family)
VGVVVELKGGVAFITGAASGMGRATARRLAEEGMELCLYDLNGAGLSEVAEPLGALAITGDVADFDQITSAIGRCVEELGGLDLAYLNAGISSMADFNGFNLATYRRVTGTNLDGVVFGAHAAVKAMQTRTDGRTGGTLIMTASSAGLRPFAGDPIYTLTKAAVVSFAQALAPALAADGITVHTICPGTTNTGFVSDAMRAAYAKFGVPLISPENIARVVVHAATAPPETSGTAWVFADEDQGEPYAFEFGELPDDRSSMATDAFIESLKTG